MAIRLSIDHCSLQWFFWVWLGFFFVNWKHKVQSDFSLHSLLYENFGFIFFSLALCYFDISLNNAQPNNSAQLSGFIPILIMLARSIIFFLNVSTPAIPEKRWALRATSHAGKQMWKKKPLSLSFLGSWFRRQKCVWSHLNSFSPFSEVWRTMSRNKYLQGSWESILNWVKRLGSLSSCK